MVQATVKNNAERPANQFETRGYVLSEDADFALTDRAKAFDAIAQLCEDRTGDMPEIPPANWAGLLRTFSRQANAIHHGARATRH